MRIANSPVGGQLTVCFSELPQNVTGIRLETLPHPTLPSSGPGLAANGNFLLVEMLATSFAEVFELGDINQDGNINLLDVAPFVGLLSNGGFQPEGDLNNDCQVNLLDVAPFIEALSGN